MTLDHAVQPEAGRTEPTPAMETKDERETSADGGASDRSITTKDGKPCEVTKDGSLSLLALGYRGLMAWRAERARSGKEPPASQADEQA